MRVTREQVLRYRVHRHQLARSGAHPTAAVLDLGVQDTGPDGAPWAMAIRGAAVPPAELAYAWTLRGAPHACRRADVAAVAAATRPWDDKDAAKRIFDAAKPLREAGIGALDAIDRVASAMAGIVDEPTVKGELSSALTEVLEPPYLRWCRPCEATHSYEQTFRIAALQAGLELEPGTSPPVLRPVPGWSGPATSYDDRLDPIRAVLHLLGPADPKLVAGYIDAPVASVKTRWPDDVVPIDVEGTVLDVLEADLDAMTDPPSSDVVRLLGPFDLFLQGRDRDLVVPDADARRDLWRVLGRPGGVLVGHEVVGSWRPRQAGGRLRLQVTVWDGGPVPPGVEQEAERLAAFRGQAFAGFVDE